ncbi:MAG: hypothetical protein ACI8QS_001660 [Planctomycetota bacterium]|jgi:hypothetical protein
MVLQLPAARDSAKPGVEGGFCESLTPASKRSSRSRTVAKWPAFTLVGPFYWAGWDHWLAQKRAGKSARKPCERLLCPIGVPGAYRLSKLEP